MSDIGTSVNFGLEKLHYMFGTDDSETFQLKGQFIPGYFRAFITEDRENGDIYLKLRFKQVDGTKDWKVFKLAPEMNKEESIQRVVAFLPKLFALAGSSASVDVKIQTWKIPESIRDDSDATMNWLIQQDLVEVMGTGNA